MVDFKEEWWEIRKINENFGDLKTSFHFEPSPLSFRRQLLPQKLYELTIFHDVRQSTLFSTISLIGKSHRRKS